MDATTTCSRTNLSASSWLQLWPGALAAGDSWFGRIYEGVPWRRETYRMFGRDIDAPRLVSWHGDPGASYRYSGVRHEPSAWTMSLSAIRKQVETITGLEFNSVLANLYRDGRDSMGWHSDDEPEVGPTSEDRWIASLSLGQPRRFLLRHRRTKHKIEFVLSGGDLLVMRGTTQAEYQHAVPKTARPIGSRINLTFRHICGGAR